MLWPAFPATLVLTCVQTAVAVHVFARIVVVVPVTLSLSVAVAQSYVTVSGQVFAYQNVSVEAFEGSVNVCTVVLSVVGVLMPSCAPYVPLCFAAVLTVAVPVVVQPLKLPVSKPPFVSAPPAAVTVSETVAEWVVEPPVPV